MLKTFFVIAASCMAWPSHATTLESWLVQTDLWGNTTYQALELAREGQALTGTLDGNALVGVRSGSAVRFAVTDADAARQAFSGTVRGESIQGLVDMPDSNHPSRRIVHTFTARKIPARPAGPPRRVEFKPTDYSNEFSPHRKPVLTLWPGDTVHTSTIDSGGVDEQGVTRALFGNPQTGPFYVASAAPGDTLVIRINRLRLNRDYADSLDSIVSRALTPRLASDATRLGKAVRWILDREQGTARLENPGAALKSLVVPVRPMLGGLGVAPGFGSAPLSTGDTGSFGGNMDFNDIVEGNTVYLPVYQPGALLYLGDAHALQGDGETSQYALETSMDVELTVDVLHGKSITMPRVESPTQLMVLGQAGSLDDATRAATTGMARWLESDYGLSLSEVAQLLGSSAQYSVANLAGRSVGVVVKMNKSILNQVSVAAH
ncbi:MAG: acetamidase/formamidase family protein [Tahibacter sp.]